MTTNPKKLECMNKENKEVAPAQSKKDKNSIEQPQPKKTILGEAYGSVTVVEEPSSPEDTRLLNRKRQMKPLSCASFSFKLNY